MSGAAAATSFHARLDSAKAFTAALSSLSTKKEALFCEVSASPEQLVFTVSSTSTTEALFSLPNDVFEEYEVDRASVRFAVNLNSVLDCLQIFGTSSGTVSVTMSYSEVECLFKLCLEEAGVITMCELPTLYEGSEGSSRGIALAYKASQEACSLIFKSEGLREALSDLLDVSGAASVKVELLSEQGARLLRMTSEGSAGSCSLDFPEDSSVFVAFETQSQGYWHFAIGPFTLGMRGLHFARETCLRLNVEGILCLQHQVTVVESGERTGYIDFLLQPLDTEA
jgi:hypothetical protein